MCYCYCCCYHCCYHCCYYCCCCCCRIKERAYQLRDARESARQAEVKAKYDLQWRDACDDARTLDSKAMLRYMNQQRLEQIEEKKRRRAQLSQQENAFFDEWNRQLEALAARDAEKRAQRARIDKETSDEIKAQVNMRMLIY